MNPCDEVRNIAYSTPRKSWKNESILFEVSVCGVVINCALPVLCGDKNYHFNWMYWNTLFRAIHLDAQLQLWIRLFGKVPVVGIYKNIWNSQLYRFRFQHFRIVHVVAEIHKYTCFTVSTCMRNPCSSEVHGVLSTHLKIDVSILSHAVLFSVDCRWVLLQLGRDQVVHQHAPFICSKNIIQFDYPTCNSEQSR